MKSLRVKFIGSLLVLMIIGLIFSTYFVYKFSGICAEIYPMFQNMRYPMLFMCEAIIVLLITAIFVGILALVKYGREEIFHREMLYFLQVISILFIGIFLISILIILYTNFNLDGSISNLLFVGTAIISMLVAQIFLLLSDLIKEGISLKEENDLTI